VNRTDREAAYVDYVTSRRDHLRRVAYALCGGSPGTSVPIG
jgi:hypothetical protein